MSKQEELQNEENFQENAEETTGMAEGNTSCEENEEQSTELTPEERITALEAELEKEKKEYMFLMAEFDNFRKRTIQEKEDFLWRI